MCQFTSFMIQNMIKSVSLFTLSLFKARKTNVVFVLRYELFPMRNIESYHILHCVYTHVSVSHIFFSFLLKSNRIKLGNKFIIYSISKWRWLIIQFKILNSVFWLNSTACTQNCAALRRLRLFAAVAAVKTVSRIWNYTIFMDYNNVSIVCMHLKRKHREWNNIWANERTNERLHTILLINAKGYFNIPSNRPKTS